MKKSKTAKPPSEEYARFEDFTRRLMAVPKKEIDAEKAKYDRKKLNRKRKAA